MKARWHRDARGGLLRRHQRGRLARHFLGGRTRPGRLATLNAGKQGQNEDKAAEAWQAGGHRCAFFSMAAGGARGGGRLTRIGTKLARGQHSDYTAVIQNVLSVSRDRRRRRITCSPGLFIVRSWPDSSAT